MVDDIHDSIDAEFDLVIPPQPDVQPETYADEPQEEPDEINITLPPEPVASPVMHSRHHTSVPEKGLTAWLYHMHLKTQLSRG